ncbi:ABC-three component system middle component 8 [Sulfurimonas sp.]|uniref:ABC-three component system middle component 8 n=1 Tax=Sulfurimonas sp. TaxID=2022749 RepID=UPI002B498A3C|nr:ABC-three component system middle component 8 [Sulfurimonas sp.]
MTYIKPHKLKPLNEDILVVSKYIINDLKDIHNQEDKISNVLLRLKNKLKISDKSFIFSLNFLYMFNKIEYKKNEDKVLLK